MTTEPWRELAQYMSELSELAYCAGWMSDLEYDLWRIVRGGARNYGLIDLTDERLGRLRRLSERAGGWVHYTDLVAEQFVPLDEWEKLYRVWESAPGGAD